MSKVHTDLQHLVAFLPEHQAVIVKQLVEALIEKGGEQPAAHADQGVNVEDLTWLEADLGGPLPPYEWGPTGPPAGKPIRYIPGQGIVIEEEGEADGSAADGR